MRSTARDGGHLTDLRPFIHAFTGWLAKAPRDIPSSEAFVVDYDEEQCWPTRISLGRIVVDYYPTFIHSLCQCVTGTPLLFVVIT